MRSGLWIGQQWIVDRAAVLRNPTMIGLSLAIINQAFDPADYWLMLITHKMGMKLSIARNI